MKEINHNLLEDPTKFQLVALGVSTYQKTNGECVVGSHKDIPTQTLLYHLSQKMEQLPSMIGKSVEKYGGHPAELFAIKPATKFFSFPITPVSIRAEVPDNHVLKRFRGKFKKRKLLPGWMCKPRIDMVEYSAIKLKEIAAWNKLERIAIPFDCFNLYDDEKFSDVVKNILRKYLDEKFYICYHSFINKTEPSQMVASSEKTLEE